MKRRLERILLDTNLLLLWLVARTDPSLIFDFKRVSFFQYDDIQLLRQVMAEFRDYVSTPHVLTEASNFIRQAPAHRQDMLNGEFKRYVAEAVEVYVAAGELITAQDFDTIGLTDAAIFELGKEAMIVSMDYRLTGRIIASGGYAANFRDLRLSRGMRR